MSTSSQRGSMIGPATTSRGSMAELPQVPRVLSEGAIGCRHRRGPTASSEPPSESAAHVTARAFQPWQTSNQLALPGWPVEVGRLNECVNCAGFSVPPRRSARDGASGEDSMLTLETGPRQIYQRMAMDGDARQSGCVYDQRIDPRRVR